MGEGQRHVLGARRLVGPLDQRVRHPGRVAVGQVGLQGDLGARLLAGGDQQRRVVGLGVEDRPHRVADPGRGVEVDDGGPAGGLGEAVGHPDHDRLLEAEHVAEVRRESRRASAARSSRGCRTSSSSRASRKRSKARLANRRHRAHPTATPLASAGARAGAPIRPELDGHGGRRGLKSVARPICYEPGRAALAALLALRAAPRCMGRRAPAAAEPGADPDRLTPRARSSRSRPRSRTKPATWSTGASSPTCAGSPPASRSTSPTATPGRCPDGETRRLQRLPRPTAPITTTASPSTSCPVGDSPRCDSHWTRDHPPRPLGRAAPEPARSRPSAGSATTATPATAAATTSTSPGTTPPATQFQLAEWVEVFRPPTRHGGCPGAGRGRRPAEAAQGPARRDQRGPDRRRLGAPAAVTPTSRRRLSPSGAGLSLPWRDGRGDHRAGGSSWRPSPGAAARATRRRRSPASKGRVAYLKALHGAPGEVTLGGETPISDCLTENQTAGDLTTVGEALVDAATKLNAQARDEPGGAANLQLGYLIGAAQRGADDTEGIHTDLIRRLVVAARFGPEGKPLPRPFIKTYGKAGERKARG